MEQFNGSEKTKQSSNIKKMEQSEKPETSESDRIFHSSQYITKDLSQVGTSKRKKCKILKYTCSFCKYTSNRKFNIIRHEKRIHETMKKVRICCGNKYNTKGEYYLHCECVHPHTRSKATISHKIYQIVGCTSNDNVDKELTNEEKENEKSERLKQQDIYTQTLPHSSCTPNHNNHRKEGIQERLQEKESSDSEYQDIKINFSSIDDLNTFTELQKMYLQDIDFDSFPAL